MSSSSEALAWAWRQDIPRRPLAKLLLVAIAGETTRIKDGPFTAEPGLARLSRLTGMHESAVRRNLAVLAEAHLLTKHRSADNQGRRARDRYELPVVIAASVPQPKSAPSLTAESPVGREPTGTRAQSQTVPEPDESGAPSGTRAQTSTCSTSSNDEVLLKTSAIERPIIRELCDHLADWVARNDEDGKRPNVTKRWLDACRLMIDVDERDPEKIRVAIDWCQRSEFWRTNIRSMSKLRDQYATLRGQAQAEQSKAGRPSRDFQAEREQQVQDQIRRRQADPLASAR